jgi:hypothetical protein
MSLSESCGCGASFSAERAKDELKLLNQWRQQHKCFEKGDLAIVDSSRTELANYHPIGFSPFGDDGEEED